MRQSQRGFTLIELMIVVAIVGILASVAIPAYSDYTVRAKVTEGIAAAGAAKTSVADYYYANNALPTSNSEAGLGTSTSYSTDIISEISVLDSESGSGSNGTIEVTYKEIGGEVTDGDKLTISPTVGGNGVTWDCSVSGLTPALPSKYAPASCR